VDRIGSIDILTDAAPLFHSTPAVTSHLRSSARSFEISDSQSRIYSVVVRGRPNQRIKLTACGTLTQGKRGPRSHAAA